MAVGRLNLQSITAAGTVITAAAASPTVDGDKFQNDGNTILKVINGSGASINVTIVASNPCNQGFTHDLVVAVAAGATKYIGKLNPNQFNDAAGDVLVKCSAIVTVTLAAVRV